MRELVIKSLGRCQNRLSCNIIEAGQEKELWVETESEYSEYLVDDRADAFFLICLYKAIKEEYDLVSEVPVSERTYYQACRFMLNLYSEAYHKEPIRISVHSLCEELKSAGAVGTGITCGVDSLYSVAIHSGDGRLPECMVPDKYKVTHLVLLNVGSHDIGHEDSVTLFTRRSEIARKFCREYGYGFVKIDTNFRTFLPYDYTEYHGIVNGSTILSLQKLFSIYYSSSSYKISEFKLNNEDVSQFELFNLSVLSNDTTTFYSTGGDVSRYDKVKLLAKWEPSYHYLNVCNSYSDNCGKYDCVKCCRTMIELDVVGALEKYDTVFDVEHYKKHLNLYLSEFWARKVLRHDHYAIELWDDLSKKYSIPFIDKLKALLRFVTSRMKIYSLGRIKHLIKISR